MPAVKSRKKATAGKDLSCGRCGKKVEVGETYFFFSFRYGGRHVRCKDHYPKQSELTQSKLSAVYGAIEDAEDSIAKATVIADIVGVVQSVADTVNEIAEEYREAAEHFGGGGENAERADELEGFAGELEGWEPDDVTTEAEDCSECGGTGEIEVEHDEEGNATETDPCEACDGTGQIEPSEEDLEQVREQATNMLGEMPL